MTSRSEKLKNLFEVIKAIYTASKDPHPEVAAQFHVEGFVSRHKHDKYFDDILQMEIEDCSRGLPSA